MEKDRVVTFEMIMEKILTSDKQYDISKIQSAYQFAAKAHEGQFRSSGQPYIIHPLAVAELLLDLGMDTDTICAALLHDVVEDTPVTDEELRMLFGHDVGNLVDGVTKLTQIPLFRQDQKKAENILKMLLAMDEDVRVMIIKLCDRMHNMRTLQFRPEHKQQQQAYETMNVYAPIAGRLGMKKIQEELETISLSYLDPFGYGEITKQLENTKEEREQFIVSIKNAIAKRIEELPFQKTPEIQGRVKSIYGMYKKMFREHKSFEQVYDKYAVRILVATVPECYMALGLVHDMYRPLKDRIKDYISLPKENGYQSLHTTVLGKEGIPFEVQIRTWEMHKTAEYGVAAHWKYKEGIQGKDKMEEGLSWVRKILEAQKSSDDPDEILSTLKIDLSPDVIMVMTPKGDAISLPAGATPIDFAYKIHTQIGHKMMCAKVEGKMVQLDTKLQTGQICEIITSKDPNKGPNRAWMNIAKTSEAKAKIRAWFKKEKRQENIETGKAMLEKEFRHSHIHIPEEDLETFFSVDMKRHSCNTLDDFYASIGYGGISITKLAPKWKDLYMKTYKQEEEPEEPPIVKPVTKPTTSQIILDEIRDCEHKLAQCCNPLYGDEIVGFVTRGHGLSIHRTDCINYLSMLSRNIPEEKERWLSVQWTDNSSAKMRTNIEVLVFDRVGMMFDIAAVMKEAGISMNIALSQPMKGGKCKLVITVEVLNKTQLTAILERLRKIKNVISAERASSTHTPDKKRGNA